ncbi:MAG: hypothetical protein GY865_10290 [candidate division Zixibacteria bacterium]|nr:hypothetical protein [candidate division Zixibacteria bacterium]
MISIIIIFCLISNTSFTNEPPKVVHVFVALCDNENQGIVPVSAELGNGNNPDHNLYWGALYGVKTFFRRDKDWKLIKCVSNRSDVILESCIFKLADQNVYLVADAYKGKNIKQSIQDFINSAGCNNKDSILLDSTSLRIGGDANLVAYIGHNGLMEFSLDSIPKHLTNCKKDAIVLACASRYYFSNAFEKNNVNPLLWTTNLMAPEAYTLEAALNGWVMGENKNQIVLRAAKAYSKYQKCSLKSAKNLFVHGYNEDNN